MCHTCSRWRGCYCPVVTWRPIVLSALTLTACTDHGAWRYGPATVMTVFDGADFSRLEQVPAPPSRGVSLVSTGTSTSLVVVGDVSDTAVALFTPEADSFSNHTYASPPARAVVTADLDHDGAQEVLVLGSAQLRVFRPDGAGGLQLLQAYNASADRAMAVADLDGDGSPEIVSAGALGNSGLVEVRRNSGGELSPPETYDCGVLPSAVAVADFNHDGLADIAVANMQSFSLTILWGLAAGAFQRQDVPTVGAAHALAAADIDGDGIADLVVAGGGEVAVLHGSSAGVVEAARFKLPSRGGEPGALATFGAENGMARIVGTDAYNASVWMMSNGDAPKVIATGTGPVPLALTVGDLTGDGIPDIVVGNYGADATL